MSFHLLTSCLPLHSQTLKKSFASTVPANSPLIITLIHLDPCPQHSSKTVLTNLPTTLRVPAMFHSLSLWFWCGRLLAFVGNSGCWMASLTPHSWCSIYSSGLFCAPLQTLLPLLIPYMLLFRILFYLLYTSFMWDGIRHHSHDYRYHLYWWS